MLKETKEFLAFLLSLAVVIIKLLKGEAFILRKLKDYEGSNKSARELFRESRVPIKLVDNKGRKFVIVHGNPDGTVRIDNQNRPAEEIREYISDGFWFLLSCFNDSRQDIKTRNKRIYRDRRTATRYPIFIVWLGANSAIVSSSRTVTRLSKIWAH